jgi:hypothetical protein
VRQVLRSGLFSIALLAGAASLAGCPMVDSYFIEGSTAGAAPLSAGGASGLGANGGTPADAGDDAPDSNVSGGGGAPVGGSATGGDATGGDTASGSGGGASRGGSAPVAGDTNGLAGVSGSDEGPGDAGAPGIPVQPLCGDNVVKGSACSASSVRLCYRSCGPDARGYKSETCQGGSYVEQDGCTFPAGQDYSCYKIPSGLPSECPTATVPRAGTACQIAKCTACFGGSASYPMYQDSTGTQKQGYCVCSDAGNWTCASVPSWPCPAAAGCN